MVDLQFRWRNLTRLFGGPGPDQVRPGLFLHANVAVPVSAAGSGEYVSEVDGGCRCRDRGCKDDGGGTEMADGFRKSIHVFSAGDIACVIG